MSIRLVMSQNQISPISLQERIEVLYVLRGLAVCGILIGNMQWFSGYGMMPASLARQSPLADQVTHFLVWFFVEGKFYSIRSEERRVGKECRSRLCAYHEKKRAK